MTTEIITEITGPNKMLYDTSATLRIKPSKNDDSTYVCVMSSEAMKDGEIKSQMMKLNVQSKKKQNVTIEINYITCNDRIFSYPRNNL